MHDLLDVKKLTRLDLFIRDYNTSLYNILAILGASDRRTSLSFLRNHKMESIQHQLTFSQLWKHKRRQQAKKTSLLRLWALKGTAKTPPSVVFDQKNSYSTKKWA